MKFKLIAILLIINSLFSFSQEKNVKPYKVLKGHEQKVQGVIICPNGNFIISYGWDNTVRIWDMEKSAFTDTLDGQHFTNWMSAQYNPGGKFLIAGTPESNILIWEMALLIESS